mmetsp:Transcript_5940/g.17779  ORF Transcript_5940/g.17779 Transcript_5940/m.17779 type:complete len:359 (+) Transcript_5940:90-1166(+)
MSWGLLEEALEHIGFAKQHLHFSLAEVVCGHLLQKEGHCLEVHSLQAGAEVRREARAKVDEERLEPGAPAVAAYRAALDACGKCRLCDECVPESHATGHRELTDHEARDPAEGGVQEVYALQLQVLRERSIDAPDYVLEPVHHPLYPGLAVGVVVEDLRQDLRDAPVAVGLSLGKLLLAKVPYQLGIQPVHAALASVLVMPPGVRERHHDQRKKHVVQSLHVSAGRLPYRPDEEHSLHQRLNARVLHNELCGAEAAGSEPRPRQVLSDLPQQGALTVALALARRGALAAIQDRGRRVIEVPPEFAILLTLALQSLQAALARERPVAEEQLPDLQTAQALGDTRPCELCQCLLVDRLQR